MAYVYRHIRLDKNIPFYIGIGQRKNRSHERFSRNNLWNKIAIKTNYEVEILFDNISWEFAGEKEKEFIKLYGRIDLGTGTLANMTDGGIGCIGFSEETLKKIGEASKGRIGNWVGKKMSEESKRKMSISKKGKSIKGHAMSDYARELLAKRNKGNKYNKGNKHTEAAKIKISEKKIGKSTSLKGKVAVWLTGEKNGMYGKKHSIYSRKKNSDAQLKRPVIQYDLNGNLVKEYPSIVSAAIENKIFQTGIQATCKGRFNSYKKFIWEYKK